MAVTLVGTPALRSLPAGGEGTSTFSVTVPSGASTLVVAAENRAIPPRTITSIKFNGVDLTSRVSQQDAGNSVRTEIWTLDSPSASTANVVVTWSASPARGAVTAFCLSGAKSGAPSATGGASGGVVAVSSWTNGIVIAAYAVDQGDTTTIALTAGSEISNQVGSAGAGTASSRQGVSQQAGTGSSVSTTWTPTPSAGRAAAIAAASFDVAGPTITTQPTAQAGIVTPAQTATFSTAATGTGTVSITAQIEDSVGGGTYSTLAAGSGATWTGLTASGSGSASTSLVGTFSATTQTGKRIRFKVDDDNGTTYSDAVVLTVKAGTTITSPSTNGSGVATAVLTSDVVNGTGSVKLVTVTHRGVTMRTTARKTA